jgi:hypothetical protein
MLSVSCASRLLSSCHSLLCSWTVRILSKSNLFPKIAERIPEKHRQRIIFGVSTGTISDELGSSASVETRSWPRWKRSKMVDSERKRPAWITSQGLAGAKRGTDTLVRHSKPTLGKWNPGN